MSDCIQCGLPNEFCMCKVIEEEENSIFDEFEGDGPDDPDNF